MKGGPELHAALLKGDSNNTLDELMHLAGSNGTYDDYQLARAADLIPDKVYVQGIPFLNHRRPLLHDDSPPEGNDPATVAARRSWVLTYSRFFHDRLRKHCKPI